MQNTMQNTLHQRMTLSALFACLTFGVAAAVSSPDPRAGEADAPSDLPSDEPAAQPDTVPQSPIEFQPNHTLLESPTWLGNAWRVSDERTLATVELDDSRLELVEVRCVVEQPQEDSADVRPSCRSLYQLVEVAVDAFGVPVRRELFAPMLMRPAYAECVSELWPEELELHELGGSPLAARAMADNLVQVVRQRFERRQVIAFISDLRAADGGAWRLVVAPIVMGRVRMELAEVVFRGYLEEAGDMPEIAWTGRSE